MSFLKPLFSFLFIASLSFQAVAQNVARSAKGREHRVMQERHALEVLNGLLQDTEKLEDNIRKPVNVLYIKYRIADLLWAYDQPKARQLFIESFHATDKRIEPEISIRLRSEIIDFLLSLDAVLAEELATSVVNIIQKNNPESDRSRMNGLSQQATLLLQIAEAMEPPEQAARLIKSSFNGWISGKHTSSLQKLRRKSPALADELFLHAIAVVQRKPTHISNKIGILAPYLFTELSEEKSSAAKQSSSELVKAFLDFVYDSFVPQAVATQVNENDEFSTSSFDYLTMQRLIPYFEKHQPEKAKAYRERIEEIMTKINQLGRKSGFDGERDAYIEAARQNAAELIEKAEKENDATKRDDLYSNALFALILQGKYEQAISHFEQLGSKISSREGIAKTLYGMAASFACEQGKLDQCYEYAKHISDSENRLQLMIELAKKRFAQGDVSRAHSILEEIKPELEKVSNEWSKPRFASDIAVLETKINPAQGARFINDAIKILNQEKDEKTLGFQSGVGYGPNGLHLTMNENDLSEGISLLAQKDFARALSLVGQIQNKERAIWAKLAVCKGVLQNVNSKPSQ